MTLDEYNELKLQDELQIGYEIEGDDLPDQYDELFDDQTDGFNAIYDPLDELFGEPVAGYSLY